MSRCSRFRLILPAALVVLALVAVPARTHQQYISGGQDDVTLGVTAQLLDPFGEDVSILAGWYTVESWHWITLTNRNPNILYWTATLQADLDAMTGTDAGVVQVAVTYDDPETPEDEGSAINGLGLSAQGSAEPGLYVNQANSLGITPRPANPLQYLYIGTTDDHSVTVVMPMMW